MKIVIVSCVVPPEPGVTGSVNRDIADMLSDYGHEVVLITPYPSRPLESYIKTKRQTGVTEVKTNFKHVRLNSFVYPKYNLLLRSYESWDFGYKAIKYINKHYRDADVIYATPWPFLGQYAFVKFKKNRNIPLIMSVQDLYPESFFAKIKSKWMVKLCSPLIGIDKIIARQSTHITCVSENIRDIYIKKRGVTSTKISVLENWQDESEFIKPVKDREAFLNEFLLQQIKGKFVFMYLGNIGPVAGLEKVIEEFSLLDANKNVLLIGGSGSYKEVCISLVERLNIHNVLFTSVPPGLKSVVELQSIADVLLLPINPQAAGSSVPSKLIAYLFSSKPIITSAEKESDTGKVILEGKCGWLVNSRLSWQIAMDKAASISIEERQEKGKNGFEYAMGRFSKKAGLKKVKELIEKFS